MQVKKKVDLRYAPIQVLLSFLIFTELLVWIGPIEYKVNNWYLIPYLIILNLSLWIGYKRGVHRFRPTQYALSYSTIKQLIIWGSILSLISLINRWSSHGISLSMDSFVNSLTNPGDAYYSKSEEEVTTNFVMMLLSPIEWAVIPFGLYAWSKISRKFRTIVILTILITVISWLGIGVRKGIFDIILIIASCGIAANYQSFSKKEFIRRFKIGLIIFLSAFLLYFIYSNISRLGRSDFSDLATMGGSNLKSSYIKVIGFPLTVAIGFIASYLCQGYFALSKGLSMGIIYPAFMGSSWFTIALSKKFSYDPTPYTYTKILEAEGIDMAVNWHTLYLWLANDFTFIGVPFIMFFIGYFFAKSWCDCLIKKNPLAYPLMALFVIMVFYAFANNQVFSFSFIPFLFWFSFYLLKSKRYR